MEKLQKCVDAEDWSGAVALANGVFLEGFSVPGASGFEDWMAALRPHYAEAHADVMSDPERGPKEMKQWMVENRARFDAA